MVRKIIGPPGTGKTTYLIKEVVNAGIPWEKILFTSLTRAAVNEAVDRAATKGASQKQLPWFKTTHAINLRLLGGKSVSLINESFDDFAKEYSYRFTDTVTKSDITKPVGFSTTDGTDDFLLRAYDKARNLMIDPITMAECDRDLRPFKVSLRNFITRYEQWKDDHNEYDFIDLISDGIKEGLVPPVELAVFDEFQDYSPLMVEQVRRWAKEIPNVIIGGDANQAIYEFIGTKPELFADFEADETIMLKKSWRVPKNHLTKALSLIRKNKGNENLHFDSSDLEGKTVSVGSIHQAAEGVKRLGPDKTYLVLARDRWGVSEAREAFREAGIPVGGSKAKLDAVSLILRKPSGLTRYEMDVLLDPVFSQPTFWERGAKAKIKSMIKEGFPPIDIDDLPSLGGKPVLVNALKTGDIPPLKMSIEEIRYYENIVRNWNGCLSTVIVSNIHQAKGSEADVVILMQGITKSASFAEKSAESIESERRVWYVALTRAKHLLVIVEGCKSYYKTKMI